MAVPRHDKAAPEPALGPEIARLSFAIEPLTKSIERLDREIVTLRSDARSDFRLLFGAVIASAPGLAGLIARTAHWF